MPNVSDRRVSLFGAHGMKMLDISKRPTRPYPPQATSGLDVLPWIEQYTQGNFYLSDYSVGFADEYDLFMFRLTFKR